MMRGVCKCKCNGINMRNEQGNVSDKEEDDWIDTPAKDNHLADEGLGVVIEQEDILRDSPFTSPIFQVLKSNIKGSRSLTKERSEEISILGAGRDPPMKLF
ncbi:hypothetical protein RHMOL_Rhmol01G0311900 [Rhododendron molle]|uniref:Uncharacterized protein n=1 Tax=Rhododendron molle TaxID=49168 RepID=A0ACC0Q8X1_RHOML|nr:hypothetical protein RHMOL_Rhmol01G0311900 [Rhododendron molle]